MHDCAILILAAGRGTRMRSSVPKVLHHLAFRPLLAHVLVSARALRPSRIVVVVGHGADQVKSLLAAPDIVWVDQEKQLGTGHAVLTALPALPSLSDSRQRDLLILSGDTPLLDSATLTALLENHRQHGRALTLATTTLTPPDGYGRIVRGADCQLLRVVEERDADPQTRAITEVNSGTYCVSMDRLENWLRQITPQNAQGEYYLTDIIAMAVRDAANGGKPVGAFHHRDNMVLAGINSRRQLADMEAAFRDRLVARWMEAGVTFMDPASCWLAADVSIGEDTVILPGVILESGVTIGRGCRIGPHCQITASRIGDGCEVLAFCHLERAELEGPNIIGPYARLRPGAILKPKARVGNFVEIKKSVVGVGSKVSHLTYIGDAQIGQNVNVGAGTITCNYDGVHKHATIIEDGVFIGSNTELVAPVRIGAGATVGAGSTVTKDVPPGALALSRSPQRVVPEWQTRKKPKEKK
ncbi:MAG: bifunctional UDP-N-acetylglucosamine diphosphorylase/glucosamine-1-phosphate N-acetyltransferase GlmU [Magnetococcales bacterium]|nr:bifunctional UDP-N-acetylglucosamine diphosphorylase/glucosamine-1-phosphate N-acetyltransferase GlmU [Magnetococcales bacterium]